MTIYKARKGNVEVYIQLDALAEYDELGYDIIRVTETKVKNVANEIEKLGESTVTSSLPDGGIA